jgi:hypothetical protein
MDIETVGVNDKNFSRVYDKEKHYPVTWNISIYIILLDDEGCLSYKSKKKLIYQRFFDPGTEIKLEPLVEDEGTWKDTSHDGHEFHGTMTR